MSNNIWWCDTNHPAWEALGADCSALHRAPGLFRLYKETAPDIIGLQECSARMSHALMTVIAEEGAPYALLWGRNTPIVYRTDKFELVDSKVCVYPENIPEHPGSFNDLRTKSYCIAVLRLKETKQLLIFATTHLWYKSGNPASPSYQEFSEEAKAYQLGMLMDQLDILQEQYNCPAVIVGDFNTYPNSLAVRSALKRGFVHAHDAATEHVDETRGMHRCNASGYDPEPGPGDYSTSIDHILVRGTLAESVRRFERYSPDYYMPLSDHFPAWIDVVL